MLAIRRCEYALKNATLRCIISTMARGRRLGSALRDVVDLKVAMRARTLRLERVESVFRRRRADLDSTVPKRRAAELLGVSVPTLDRWIERGRIPTARRSPAGREELQTGPLLELAVEVELIRGSGVKHPLPQALERLEERDRTRGVTRGVPMGVPGFYPDQRLDRRHDFETLTEVERVLEAIELSRVGARLAVAGARARARQ